MIKQNKYQLDWGNCGVDTSSVLSMNSNADYYNNLEWRVLKFKIFILIKINCKYIANSRIITLLEFGII